MVRATQDVDLLTEAERADDVEAELLRLGYRCLYRSADAANYGFDELMEHGLKVKLPLENSSELIFVAEENR